MRVVFCWLHARFMMLAACVTLLAPRGRAQSAPLLSGRVTDAATGSALGGVELWLTDGARTLTGADGRFRLRALDPGPALLQARRVGYIALSRTVSISNGQDITLALSLTPVPSVLTTIRVRDTVPTTADITRISRDAIARSSARDLGEVLRGVPGLVLIPRGGPGSPVTVSIRGSRDNQVLVLIDGTPLNDPVTGAADLSAVDPAIIESVDVVRGAQSSRYGSQALAGVIAVTTRSSGSLKPTVTLGGGQWGERRVSGSAAGERTLSARRLSAQNSLSWQQLTGDFPTQLPAVRGGGATRRVNGDMMRRAASAATALHGARTLWDLRGDVSAIDRGMPGSIVQPSLTARQTQRRAAATASLTVAPTGQSWLRTTLTVQHQRGRFADTAPPFNAPYNQQQRVTTFIGTVAATSQWRSTALTAGMESRTLSVTGTAINNGSNTRVALGGAWVGAVRTVQLDRWQLEFGSSARTDVGTLWRGVYLSPDVHATAHRGSTRITGGWRSAFAAPSLGDLFFQEGVQVRANPTLRPERVRGEWHLTTELTPRDVVGLRASGSLSAFLGDIDDFIIWSPDFRFVWQPNNFDVTRRGVDASLRMAMPSNRLALTLTGSHVDVRYRGPVLSGQVVYRPQHTGAATLDLAQGAWDAQLALQAMGLRQTVVASEINRLPAFQLMQARVARHVMRGALDARLRISIDNLLDQRIATLADFPQPGRSWAVDVTFQPRRRLAARSSPTQF
jgi:outer membrane cobalamin receptor